MRSLTLIMNSWMQQHPVGTKMPNKLGIYDMRGNLSEWVQDLHGHYSRLSV